MESRSITAPLRILWVRHSPSIVGRVTRDTFLLPRVARRHHVEVVTWHTRETSGLLSYFRCGVKRDAGLRTWVLPRLPRPPGWPSSRASISQPLFRLSLRAIAAHVRPDVVVVGPSWTQVGLPPAIPSLRVFDYLDGSDWSHAEWRAPERWMLEWCDAAVCVSDTLAARATDSGKPAIVIPNGVDVEAFADLRKERDRIRADLGVADRSLVTLVGLTAADDDYWIRAVRLLAARLPRFLFAAVGTGALSGRISALARDLPGAARWVGPVPYEHAMRWFVASDVTWYPGADIEYFHVASPLKIFEGLAAGAQVVVAPRLRSLATITSPALHFAPPTAEGFAAETEAALSARASAPANLEVLAPYTWDRLAEALCTFIEAKVEVRRATCADLRRR